MISDIIRRVSESFPSPSSSQLISHQYHVSQRKDCANHWMQNVSGGIGAATALALARQGCSIAVHYNSSKAQAESLTKTLPESSPDSNTPIRAIAFQADLSSYLDVRRLHEEVVQKMGHPDILFNNAGALVKTIGRMGDIGEVSIDEFEQTWRLNTGSSYLLCLPHMVEQQYGRTGGVIGPHYASSKSALHGLMHWVASRHAKDGIYLGLNGSKDTAMMANPTDEMRKMIPVGRLGIPSEISSIVEMLVTNAYMTNKCRRIDMILQIIVADGGLTASAF
ncbi:hypothetical protein D9757_008727 [Collybiopsis confluens]|uniref:NAD(P)-binding protein n=1 Tax=Collybiopsis confluens TaxID=2823264 RepID=A0A8H5M306_9AGAR|nr:hypothetical protein D9757_008727 [Collybiopsis confluens]